MAAIPYIPLYIADYLADTAHLTTVEHGAYLLLIMNYWQRGKRLSNERLANVVRMSNEQWNEIETTVKEFFVEDENGNWVHERIERDLEKFRNKSEKARAAGKASARAKAEKKREKGDAQQTLNERSTNVEQTFNHTDTDTDTEVKENTNVFSKKNAGENKTFVLPEWIPSQLWDEFLAIRKKHHKLTNSHRQKKLLVTALEKIVQSGEPVEHAMNRAILSEWKSFHPDKKYQPTKGFNYGKTNESRGEFYQNRPVSPDDPVAGVMRAAERIFGKSGVAD